MSLTFTLTGKRRRCGIGYGARIWMKGKEKCSLKYRKEKRRRKERKRKRI